MDENRQESLTLIAFFAGYLLGCFALRCDAAVIHDPNNLVLRLTWRGCNGAGCGASVVLDHNCFVPKLP